jgi:hypothetical protein
MNENKRTEAKRKEKFSSHSHVLEKIGDEKEKKKQVNIIQFT